MAGGSTKRHKAYRNGRSKTENRDRNMKKLLKKFSRNNPEKKYAIVDKTVRAKSGDIVIKNIVITNKEQLKKETTDGKN